MVPEKQKILIADDSEMNRTLLVEMLKDNFEIAEVENGAQALAALQENPGEFSLLLLDIVMPEILPTSVKSHGRRNSHKCSEG